MAGADELLVFDVVKEPEFTGVVPGGGIEPGETVEEAAVREVREETGIDIRLVRELGFLEQPGRRDPDFLHESHFVHAVPTESTEDEWEHFVESNEIEQGLVRCRWQPILAGMSVWGVNRGAFLSELLRKRVVAYLTRERDGRAELLIIEHSDIPDFVEVPAGRLDPDETLEEGLVREVEEETGVTGIRIVRELADANEFARLFGPRKNESHAFHAEADSDSGEWAHPVAGSGADAGMIHLCRWVPLDECPPLWGKPDPLVEELRRSITEE